jgi:hypothetical protein
VTTSAGVTADGGLDNAMFKRQITGGRKKSRRAKKVLNFDDDDEMGGGIKSSFQPIAEEG